MKTYTTADIIKLYPKVELIQPVQKWFKSLQVAKAQIGSKSDKIEMTMKYIKFENAQDWDSCFDYLNENL